MNKDISYRKNYEFIPSSPLTHPPPQTKIKPSIHIARFKMNNNNNDDNKYEIIIKLNNLFLHKISSL